MIDIVIVIMIGDITLRLGLHVPLDTHQNVSGPLKNLGRCEPVTKKSLILF